MDCDCFVFVLVNYRGSLGFGADSINSLPENVGKQDVQDCQVCRHVLYFTLYKFVMAT